MKYIANRNYKDIVLDRHVEKGAVLEDEYKQYNIELTEERKDYLVNERKIYIAVEEIPEGKVDEITPVDDIPEEIVEDNKEESNEEDKKEDESVVKFDEKKEEKEKDKSNSKKVNKNN